MGQQSRVGVFDLRKSPHYNINNDTPTKRIMNYLKQYCNLIRKAENRTPPEGYTEKHHTFPKSIFGKNNRIVVLTAREHYIAHALLEKICVKRYGISHWKTYKMIKAHISMKCGKYFNNRLYESSRVRYGNSIKGENNPFYNKFHTEEAKLKMSKKRSGKNNCMFGKKRTDEVKEKIKEKLSKEFIVLSPEGKIIQEKNIKQFCITNNLDSKSFADVLKGKQKCHKGWRNIKDFGKSQIELQNGKFFSILCPNGEIYTGKNISQFCRERNLDNSNITKVINGISLSYKGYKKL